MYSTLKPWSFHSVNDQAPSRAMLQINSTQEAILIVHMIMQWLVIILSWLIQQITILLCRHLAFVHDI